MNYTLVVLFAYVVVMLGATLIMTKKEDNIERFHRECLHEGLCRALLVPGAECALSDIFYPVCQTDPGGNAGGHNAVRLYIWEISVGSSKEYLPVPARCAVHIINRGTAPGRK